MTSIEGTNNSGNSTDSIISSLKQQSTDEKRAKEIGNSLASIEERYMAALSNPKEKEGNVAALEVKYRRAMRAYEAFQRLMQNSHEMLMRAIQNLAIR